MAIPEEKHSKQMWRRLEETAFEVRNSNQPHVFHSLYAKYTKIGHWKLLETIIIILTNASFVCSQIYFLFHSKNYENS